MSDENAEVQESPTVDEPSTEQPAEDQQVKAQELLETLNKLNIDSPERIEGVYQASQQAGHNANLYGDAQREVETLKQRLASLEQAPRQRQQPQDEYGYDYEQQAQPQYATPQDVERIMQKQIGNYVNMTRQAQQQQYQEWARIQQDPDYGSVKDLFEKHISNPNVQMALNNGQTSLQNELGRCKVSMYKNLALQTKSTLEGLMKNPSVAQSQAPHMEQGATTPTPGVEPTPTSRDKLQEVAQQSSGTDDDIDSMLQAMIPDNDLFLQLEGEYKQGTRKR